VIQNANLSGAALVCIVDDDASMADSTRFLVRSFGFRVKAFSSAQEFLSSGLVEDGNCLVLILDLRMPGMDGLQLQRHLISINRQVPIIFISAHANEEERRRAFDGGAVDFLSKPFNEEALFSALQVAVNR